MAFKTATRKKAKLRAAIDGPAGSGKTYTALKLGLRLAGPNGKVALLDTERGSASKYGGGKPFHFDTDEPKTFSPKDYIASIKEAAEAGYDVLIIDSLSHAWAGTGGALEIVDSHKDKFGGGWRAVTPMHNALVDAILTAPMHVIVTMRSKMEYVIDEKTRKISKVGLKPVQREGMEYEFDLVLDMNDLHVGTVSKSRCSDVADRSYPNPGDDLADTLKAWLEDGEDVKPEVKPTFKPVATKPEHVNTEAPTQRPPTVEDPAIALLLEECRKAIESATTETELQAAGAKASKLDKDSKKLLADIYREAKARVATVAA